MRKAEIACAIPAEDPGPEKFWFPFIHDDEELYQLLSVEGDCGRYLALMELFYIAQDFDSDPPFTRSAFAGILAPRFVRPGTKKDARHTERAHRFLEALEASRILERYGIFGLIPKKEG